MKTLSLESLSSNPQIRNYLLHLVKSCEIPNSLLFSGPKSAHKELFAKAFAKDLLGSVQENSPDLYELQPEGKIGMHSVDSLRLFQEEVYLPPFQAKKKVFLIHEAERMLPVSANALLKTFEEPPSHSIIILLSSFAEKLLPTILSRCHTLYFRGEGKLALESNPALMQFLVNRKKISYTELTRLAKQLAQIEEEPEVVIPDKKELTAFQLQHMEKMQEGAKAMRLIIFAEELFEQILGWFRDLLVLQLNGEENLLTHPQYRQELDAACQRAEFLPLEYVQKTIQEAKLLFSRSTPLQQVLENLFLKLL